jgi:hypothetical protein
LAPKRSSTNGDCPNQTEDHMMIWSTSLTNIRLPSKHQCHAPSISASVQVAMTTVILCGSRYDGGTRCVPDPRDWQRRENGRLYGSWSVFCVDQEWSHVTSTHAPIGMPAIYSWKTQNTSSKWNIKILRFYEVKSYRDQTYSGGDSLISVTGERATSCISC